MTMLTKGHAYDLYQLAKRCAWNPQDLDFRQDVQDWAALNPREQDILCRLLSMFVAGEEAVASDLAPLLWAIGRAGGLREEEMFLGAGAVRRRRAVRH
jgi:ribonucleoside-diphosphate reductase beta chain